MPVSFGYGFDPYYMIFVLPAIIFAMWAQYKVSGTFKRYSKVVTRRGVTGEKVAYDVLRRNGVYNVRIERVNGSLTDHYDPRQNVIRLSDSVYSSQSVAAAGVAAHEAGHAVQYASGYAPIKLRAAILPVTQIGSYLAWPLILIGLIFQSGYSAALFGAGAILFSMVVLFQLITLPVEYNASHRAVETLESDGMLDPDEIPGAKRVLSAAALTYLAALAVSIAQLLRILMIFGGGRRRND